MIKVFVIVLNWNRFDLTYDCIKSLKKLKQKDFELQIIVVDNGSNQEEYEKLIELKSNNVKVIGNNSNLGFAEGNNVGIRYALANMADYVMILNNDTIVDQNLLVNLLKTIEEDKTIGIVSPKIYFAKGYEFHKDKYKKNDLGKVIWYAGGKMDWKNIYGGNIGVDEVDKGQYDRQTQIDFATGACMLVSRKALETVGLFDKKYFMYMEDADLSYRVKAKKMKIVYAPKAKLWHKVAQSSGIGSDLNDYFICRNRLLFGFKYASLRTKFALMRESIRLFFNGRHWQAVGVRDFYLRKFEKGSWE